MPRIQILQHAPCATASSLENHEVAVPEASWRSSEVKVEELPCLSIPSNCFVFASSSVYLNSEPLRQALCHRFQIPDWFWSQRHQRSNGSFGCDDVDGNEKQLHTPQIWSRYLVKQLAKGTRPVHHEYVWYEMDFLARRTPSGQTAVLCFDTPDRFRLRLLQALNSTSRTPNEPDIYQLHTYLADQILNLYDDSVWAFRDIVREVERARSQSHRVEPDFPTLHDIARHAIHVSETLAIAIETMSSMIQQYVSFSADRPSDPAHKKTTFARTLQCFQFQLQLFKSLKARSDSNQARMQNEITLAFNLVTQRDSQTAIRISEAVRTDSTAMKTVAILTLTFLPATFVSAIFSTSFFNFSPATQSGRPSWTVSDKFWIYWAFSAPLTVATLVSWFVWQRWYGSK